jgi:DNA-binding PadR family transcriptional regulator
VALKPLVFEILLALAGMSPREGRHGWDLVREIRERGAFSDVMPGNFYRTLRTMLADGLIEDVPDRRKADPEDERRRYFRLTASGIAAAAAEAKRLEALVLASRAKKLLTRKG